MDDIFLQADQVSVKLGGTIVLDNISLVIGKNEQWAITGASGSGKTVLAHTFLGRHFHSGSISFPGLQGMPHPHIGMVEQQHRFRNSANTTELYYQQRYNAADAERTITVEQELGDNGVIRRKAADRWIDLLQIRPLLTRPLIQLSNGENKRLQLAIALSKGPGLLILDNPFLGLDTAGRQVLHEIIDGLTIAGVSFLLITSVAEIPATITHIASLEKGRIVFAGRKENFHPSGMPAPGSTLDKFLLRGLQMDTGTAFEFAVRMVNVHIRYGNKIVLNGINWQVRKGEQWSVSGPNGAGKSTLLSLITADNPQAYANEIYLFDRKRGSGETIWDIKKRIGFVSPELHLYFEQGASCFDVIASGLFDTIGLFRQLTESQAEKTNLWIKLFKLETVRSKRLSQLSAGQQRMVLLARAMIKNPPLLILDEPCQGLDDVQSAYFRGLIDQVCQAFGTTLIYVSHYRKDIPACVDKFFELVAPETGQPD